MRKLPAPGLVLAILLMLSVPAQAAETKYSIANGCFEVADAQYRFKATTLAEYLLYSNDEKFLAADGTLAGEPSEDTEWVASEEAGAVKLTPKAGGDPRTLGAAAEGCAVYPEISVNATGTPSTSKAYEYVRGTMDGHMHMMAFEFLGGMAHCGRPWHKYGVAFALKDCLDHETGGGCGAILENVLFGNPARCHDPVGWPTFKDWPHHESLTHENSYYKWLERAWMGGLRIFVNLHVENRSLCELYPLKRDGYNCNEMDSVRREHADIHELERYIDAQNGGPGKGWFRIVKDPFEARRVIDNGKLAVIEGIEISQLFNCNIRDGVPTCTKDEIDAQLEEVDKMGVSQMELVNKFDSGLGGVAGDGGTTGVIVNSGNKQQTNRYWDMRTCTVGQGDHEQPAVPRDVLIGNGLAALLPPGTAPGLPRAAALQLLRPHPAWRVRRPGADQAPDHDRPGPPQPGRARWGVQHRRGRGLPGHDVEPLVVERGRLPAHPRDGRDGHAVCRLLHGLREGMGEAAQAVQLALLQRLRLRG